MRRQRTGSKRVRLAALALAALVFISGAAVPAEALNPAGRNMPMMEAGESGTGGNQVQKETSTSRKNEDGKEKEEKKEEKKKDEKEQEKEQENSDQSGKGSDKKDQTVSQDNGEKSGDTDGSDSAGTGKTAKESIKKESEENGHNDDSSKKEESSAADTGAGAGDMEDPAKKDASDEQGSDDHSEDNKEQKDQENAGNSGTNDRDNGSDSEGAGGKDSDIGKEQSGTAGTEQTSSSATPAGTDAAGISGTAGTAAPAQPMLKGLRAPAAHQDFNLDSFVSEFQLSLNGKTYTKGDFPVTAGTIDRNGDVAFDFTFDMLGAIEEKGKDNKANPGDTFYCSVPSVIDNGGASWKGVLHNPTTKYEKKHGSVGTWEIKDGKLILHFDDGYFEECEGKIKTASVYASGSFNSYSIPTAGGPMELLFGNLKVSCEFEAIDEVRILNIDKSVRKDDYGNLIYESDGTILYTIHVSAGDTNTETLENVKITDLFRTDNIIKDSIQLVKVEYGDTKVNITSQVDALSGLDSSDVYGDKGYEVSGWNIGNLPRGEFVTLTVKARVDPEKVTSAVDAAKAEAADTDAAKARQVTNKAYALADRMVDSEGKPAVVSDSDTAYVKNRISVSKSTVKFDPETKREYYKITVSADRSNRYTMHNVPVDDSFSDYSTYIEAVDVTDEFTGDNVITKGNGLSNFKNNSDDSTYKPYTWTASVDELKPGESKVIYAWASFSKTWVSKSVGPGALSSGILSWGITVNAYTTQNANANRVSGTVTDILQKVGGKDVLAYTGDATVTYHRMVDGRRVKVDVPENLARFTPDPSKKSFTYEIPEEYADCEVNISYKTAITDFDTYVGKERTFTNYAGINGFYASQSTYIPRVVGMSKSCTDSKSKDTAEWTTKFYTTLKSGDSYYDESDNTANHYYTGAQLDALEIRSYDRDSGSYQTVDKEKYEIEPGGDSDKYKSYTIRFKDTIYGSQQNPILVVYRSTLVPCDLNTYKRYYNSGKLTIMVGEDQITDTDYDFFWRSGYKEISKHTWKVEGDKVYWHVMVNKGGYAGKPNGTMFSYGEKTDLTIYEQIPEGLVFQRAYLVNTSYAPGSYTSNPDCSRYGGGRRAFSYTPYATVSYDTEDVGKSGPAQIQVKNMNHWIQKKGNSTNYNNYNQYAWLDVTIVTKIVDPKVLMDTSGKTFTWVNNAGLTPEPGDDLYWASSNASLSHKAMSKEMVYNSGNAPNAAFTIDYNPDTMDINPYGETIDIYDTSSSTLQVSPDSIRVIDAVNGRLLQKGTDYTVDMSHMGSENTFIVTVPDERHLTIRYTAEVLGPVGATVKVSNNAYFKGQMNADPAGIEENVVVMRGAG